MDTVNPAKFVFQLYEAKTRKDGGFRIVFDCGKESAKAFQQLSGWNSDFGMNFEAYIVPLVKDGYNEE